MLSWLAKVELFLKFENIHSSQNESLPDTQYICSKLESFYSIQAFNAVYRMNITNILEAQNVWVPICFTYACTYIYIIIIMYIC